MRERVNSGSSIPLERKRGRSRVPKRIALQLNNRADIRVGPRFALFSAVISAIAIGCRASLPAAPEPPCPAPHVATSGWKERSGPSGIAFRMPEQFRKTAERGIDTDLESWRHKNRTITFWSGERGDPMSYLHADPCFRGLTECREQVGGRSVRIASYLLRDEYTTAAFWPPVAQGAGLVFAARSRDPSDQRVALTILRTVRFTFSPQ